MAAFGQKRRRPRLVDPRGEEESSGELRFGSGRQAEPPQDVASSASSC